MRRLLIGGCVALLLTPLTAGACELRLSLLPYPGYYEPGTGAQPARGLDPAIAELLASRSGCRFEVSATSSPRMWPALQAGVVDLTAGALFLSERQSEADYLWLLRSRALVLMNQSQAAATSTREAFDADPQLKLGVIRAARRGQASQTWVDSLRSQGRISESPDMPALLRAFEAGRVAAILILPGSLQERSSEWLAKHLLMDWLPQDRLTAGWAVSHRLPEAQRRRLLAAADSMLRDGSLQRLLREHLGAARSYEFLSPPAAGQAPAPSPSPP